MAPMSDPHGRVCPRCGATNASADPSCADCGAPLDALADFTPLLSTAESPYGSPPPGLPPGSQFAGPPLLPGGPHRGHARSRLIGVIVLVSVTVLAGVVVAAVAISRRNSSTGSGGQSTPARSLAPSLSSSPTSTSSAAPSSTSPAPTRTGVSPGQTTVIGHDGVSYPVHIYHADRITDCAAHAYGADAIDFLSRSPCTHAHRLIATVVIDNQEAVLSVITASFPDAATNSGFDDVENDPTCECAMKDLLREGQCIPRLACSVPLTEAFTVISDGGTNTAVFDAWWTRGHTDDQDPSLIKCEHALFQTYLTPFD